jgi:hypothetical protein
MKPIVIDLTEKRIDENWFSNFGGDVATILKALGQNTALPVTVKGSTADIKAFAKALGAEKGYMDAYHRYGLSNPATFKSQVKLNQAIQNFERNTGIKWALR